MLVFGDVGVAVLGELVQLALDHPERDVAQQPHDVERVVRERHRHRLDVEIIPEQHRDVVAPPRVHGKPAAAQRGVVDDVVVDEGGGVDELDHRGVEDGPIAFIAAQTRRHQQDGRADPFAAARLDVLADGRDQRDLRLDVAGELAIDPLEIGADRLEYLRQRGRRLFHRSLQGANSRSSRGADH